MLIGVLLMVCWVESPCFAVLGGKGITGGHVAHYTALLSLVWIKSPQLIIVVVGTPPTNMSFGDDVLEVKIKRAVDII